MNEPVPIQKVTFYDDQVRSWKEPDDRVFVVLRDPFMALGLNPTQQIERLKSNPLYEGYLRCSDIIVSSGNGATRIYEMDGIDIEMLPMCLAQLELNRINETHRPKLLRYQRECARVLRDHWKTRDTVDRYLIAGGWRPYAPEYSLDFMQTVCRLYGVPLPQTKYPCPCVVSTFIHRYIRSVLPSPVQAELRVVNPRNARGNRLRKDHQHLTEETLSKVERERIKFCHGLANSVEDIDTFTRLLAAHDERSGVIYTDTQRYGQVISLQGAFPFMLGAQSA